MKRLVKLVPIVTFILLMGSMPAIAADVDLVVDSLSWSPADNLEEGQDVSFTARIRNDGPDALTVDTCTVNFAMDGSDLGDMVFSETALEAGETVDVVFDTTVYGDDQTVTATVDSTGTITETDETNNTLSADLPAITDNNPPEAISDLAVSDSQKTSLTVTWTHSANTVGDLAGYRVYVNGTPESALLPAGQNGFLKTGLSAASEYTLTIKAVDDDGNESEGVAVTGYTVLENPIGLIAASRPAFVDLSWEPATPEDYVDHYAIYVSSDAFLTVEGMTANTTTTETSVSIDPLDSDSTYHFAVVAVNLSGGLDEDVSAIDASPMPGTAVSGNITTNTVWTVENSPYVVTGDITVYSSTRSPYSDTAPNQATLTLEPGVEVRFEQGTGLYVGKASSLSAYGYHGALYAQATSDEPIIFTSNADTPAPGEWKGIYFHNATYDAGSLIEHCTVEYAGNTNNANIYITNAKPVIRNSTIQDGSGYGIQLSTSAFPTIEQCNIKENAEGGLYLDDTSRGEISGNVIDENGGYAADVYPNSVISG